MAKTKKTAEPEVIEAGTETKSKDTTKDSLAIVKKHIEKKYGSVLTSMSNKSSNFNTISTRCMGLDAILGYGGVCKGRIIELFGENASGKSSLAMTITAEAQSRDMSVLWIDAEHSSDANLFSKYGVDIDKLQVIDAYTGEKNLMIAEDLMKTSTVDLLVVDSVTSLIPEVLTEGTLDQDTMALLARLMSKTLLRYIPIAAETNTCVIFINQTRSALGSYVPVKQSTGGNSLPFYASSRIHVKAGGKADRVLSPEGNAIGHKVTFELVKSRLSRPFTSASINLMWGEGFDTVSEVITLATDIGILDRSGSWYKYNEVSIGQGTDGVRTFFESNPDVYNEIKDSVVIALGLDKYYKAQKEYDAYRLK